MEYTLKQTVKSPTAIIKVYSPVIAEDERNKRLQRIHNAAANLLRKGT